VTEPTEYVTQLIAWTTNHDARERAAIARKARAEITRRFGEIATRHGYSVQEDGWVKTKAFMRLSFGLQPSSRGFQCYVNLGARPRSVLSHAIGVSRREVFRLGRFYDRSDHPTGELGALIYPNVAQSGTELDHACAVLDQRALPFLDKLTGRSRPDLAAFLKDCAPV
jgi:hypothetical protein